MVKCKDCKKYNIYIRCRPKELAGVHEDDKTFERCDEFECMDVCDKCIYPITRTMCVICDVPMVKVFCEHSNRTWYFPTDWVGKVYPDLEDSFGCTCTGFQKKSEWLNE